MKVKCIALLNTAEFGNQLILKSAKFIRSEGSKRPFTVSRGVIVDLNCFRFLNEGLTACCYV